MFSVTLTAASYAEEQERSMIRKMNRQIDEIEDILSSLGRMEGYEEIIRALAREKEKLMRQRKTLRTMADALNQVQRSYAEGERRILSFEEESRRYDGGDGYG